MTPLPSPTTLPSATMSHPPSYIAVEGVTGVGKTSFATMLAERLDATLALEDPFDNPFLEDFYRNRERHGFAAQMYFLLSRFQHQQNLRARDLFAQRVVTDYIFGRDALFASVTLSDRELQLYQKIAPALERDVPRPDLVIYLQANTDTLMSRIRKRAHKAERWLDREFVHKLNEAFNYYFFHYSDTPLLVVRTDNIDFVNNSAQFNELVEQIRRPVFGKKYYSPAGEPELKYKD